ncbi:hypothetical protein GQ457_01G020530 [Hibiscus cannabinus]
MDTVQGNCIWSKTRSIRIGQVLGVTISGIRAFDFKPRTVMGPEVKTDFTKYSSVPQGPPVPTDPPSVHGYGLATPTRGAVIFSYEPTIGVDDQTLTDNSCIRVSVFVRIKITKSSVEGRNNGSRSVTHLPQHLARLWLEFVIGVKLPDLLLDLILVPIDSEFETSFI